MRSCAKRSFPCGGKRATRKNLPSAAAGLPSASADVKSATSKAPYILHQIVTGEDEQKPGGPTDSSVEIRSLFCVYGEDDQEGALRLLTTVEHFRQELLMHGVIAKQFALDLSQKLSTLYYTDNTAPYFCAELVSVWKIPSVNREAFAW